MLAHDGIVFAEAHLLGGVARILLGHVEDAGVGGGDEQDLDGCGLRHGSVLILSMCCQRQPANNASGDSPPPVEGCGHWRTGAELSSARPVGAASRFGYPDLLRL